MKFIYGFITLTLVSCLSPRKADRQLSNLEDKYPSKIAQACSTNYPCNIVRIDTLYKDSLITDTLIGLIPVMDTITDTIQGSEVIKYKVITKKISLPIVIKYFEDSSKIKLLNEQWSKKLEKCKKECSADKKTSGSLSYGKIAMLFLLLLLFLFLKRKFKNENNP